MTATEELIDSFPETGRRDIRKLFERFHFTESQKLEIAKDEADLRQWKEESFIHIADYPEIEKRKDGRKGEAYLSQHRAYMKTLRKEETDYSTFFPEVHPRLKYRTEMIDKPIVLGRCPCPVDGEKTRCCKLTTMDPVEQCAFSCSYCSVQSFYSEKEIHAVSNLREKLDSLTIPEDVWHIGTGQASDSILFGDDYSTLSALSDFARKHKNIIIELKSKSGRDVFSSREYPRNMFFTWSLNAPTIIEKEEHLTATLEKRLENAARARDNGNLVGFHIHPMVYFRGWEDEYTGIVRMIEEKFTPDEIAMISIGTLTFTKSVLKKLRENGEESRVLEMELTPAAGKFSYPLDVKEKMFRTVYSSFSEQFRDNIFFYLCMEDPSLWKPVLEREYSSDKEFEMDMKQNYFRKISRP